MRFLKENYDKIAFAVGLVLCVIFWILYFLSDATADIPETPTKSGAFVIELRASDSNASVVRVETRNPHGLMPGNFIELIGATPESFNKTYLVREILFPEQYEEVTVRRRDGTELSGYFLEARGKLALDSNLAKLKVTVEVDGSSVTVPGIELDNLTGSRIVLFALDANRTANEISGDLSLVCYQRRHQERITKPHRLWPTPVTGDDNVSYDLFTPPRIFVVDGKLSPEPPKPPEAIKVKEPFGLQLISFENVPYRFNIRSWGADPLLFDQNIKRNVIVKVGQSYKQGKNWIVPAIEEDPDKIIKILDFKVEAVTDQKSGGTRNVATLKIFDFALRREIALTNLGSTMAGQLNIKVSSTLPDAVGETKDLTEKSSVFFLGGKEYRILKIDAENRSLLLEKLTDNPDEERELHRLSLTAPPQNP